MKDYRKHKCFSENNLHRFGDYFLMMNLWWASCFSECPIAGVLWKTSVGGHLSRVAGFKSNSFQSFISSLPPTSVTYFCVSYLPALASRINASACLATNSPMYSLNSSLLCPEIDSITLSLYRLSTKSCGEVMHCSWMRRLHCHLTIASFSLPSMETGSDHGQQRSIS